MATGSRQQVMIATIGLAVWSWLRRHLCAVLFGLTGWWEYGKGWGLFLGLVGAVLDGGRWLWHEIFGDDDEWPDHALYHALYEERTTCADANQGASCRIGGAPPAETSLPCRLEWFDDEEGRCLRFVFAPPPPPGFVLWVFVFPQGFHPAKAAAMPGSHFGRAFRLAGERLDVYVPFGAVALPARDVPVQVEIVLAAGTDPAAPGAPLGRTGWTMPWPSVVHDPFAQVRPIIRMALRVACSDGPLNRPEVRRIRELFEPLAEDNRRAVEQLRATLKEPCNEPPERLVEQCRLRSAGTIEPEELRQGTLSLLVSVAAADGALRLREGNELERIALAFGWSEAQWSAVATQYRIPRGRPWEVLGVPPGATREQIRASWRAQVARYHPDRFANASAERQAEAHRRMVEINEAYELMMREAAA